MFVPTSPPQQPTRDAAEIASWKLEDAKARFSEVVKLAERGVPQHVSVRGRPAVVIVAAADYARMVPAGAEKSLYSLFADSPFAQLDDFDNFLVRERGEFRDPPDFSE